MLGLLGRAKGDVFEQQALSFLEDKGLRLFKQNYHSRYGEIDLVMFDGDDLVFVEVRYRKSAAFGTGAESVSSSKQSKIIKTAQVFLQNEKKLHYRNCRFDVISVTSQVSNTKGQSKSLEPLDETIIQWCKDAFYAPAW